MNEKIEDVVTCYIKTGEPVINGEGQITDIS